MTVHLPPEAPDKLRRSPQRARSIARKFPDVPLSAWPTERRPTLLLLTALIWSSAMLLGGMIGAGIIG